MKKNNIIAILPLGAHEYHGPHLPFETDTLIAQAFAARLKDNLPAPDCVHFLPAQSVTYSREHMRVAGTKTRTYHEAAERWIKIGEAQHKKGINKFVMLNAHGGNGPLMTIVATELRARCNMLAVSTSFSRFGLPKGLLAEEERILDIHGGFIETSIMLAIAPEKVDMQKAENFSNRQEIWQKEFTYLRAYGKHAFGWLMQDINPKGAAGAANRATAQAGEQILDFAVQEAAKLFADIHNFDLTCLQ